MERNAIIDPEEARQVQAYIKACQLAMNAAMAQFSPPMVSAMVIAFANLESHILGAIEDANERKALTDLVDSVRTQIRDLHLHVRQQETRSVVVKGTRH